MTVIKPASEAGLHGHENADYARRDAEQEEFGRLARRLIRERSNALGRINHQALASAINSLPSQRERYALLALVDAHLTQAARKRLANAMRGAEPPRAAPVPQSHAARLAQAGPPGLHAVAAPKTNVVPATAVPAVPSAVSGAVTAVRSALNAIAQAYNTRPPKQEARVKMIDGLKHIQEALSSLAPGETEALIGKLSAEELKYLVLYESRLQGYLRAEEALSRQINRDYEAPLRAEEQTPAAARRASAFVFESLAKKIHDPEAFARLLTVWHEASQSGELSPALLRAVYGQTIAPDDGRFPFLNFRFTPNYHGEIVDMGRTYIASLAGQPDRLLKFIGALAPQVAANVRYPMAAAKSADGLPGDQPETHYGDARGALVADAIAMIGRTCPEKLSEAFKLVPGTVLDAVAEAASQPVWLNYRPEFDAMMWPLVHQFGKNLREEITRQGLHVYDATRAELQPLLDLIDSAKDPGLIRRDGSPEEQGDLRARMFEAGVKALDRLRVTLGSEESPINPLDLAQIEPVKDAVRRLDGLLLVQTSATIAALRARDLPGEGGRALSQFMALHYDPNMLQSALKPYNAASSSLDQMPLFRPGGPLAPLWRNLMLYDPPFTGGPDHQQPEDWAASYWLKGLGAVKGGRLRDDLGRGNWAYVAGAYWGAQQLLGTAIADHIEVERYQKERPAASALREAPNMLPGKELWFRAIVSGVKMVMSAYVETHTGWEVLNRDQIFRALAGQRQAVSVASMPASESLKRQPVFAGFVTDPLTSKYFRTSNMYREYNDAFIQGSQYGVATRTP
jgi:hypothetical protein